MARGARVRCDALPPGLSSQPLPPRGISALGFPHWRWPETAWWEARVPAGAASSPCELGAGPRADATGRGPRWPRPRGEGGAAGAAAPPPAGAAPERREFGLLHWRGGRAKLPKSRPRAGAAAAETQAGKRGRAADSGKAGCAGARRCGTEGSPD